MTTNKPRVRMTGKRKVEVEVKVKVDEGVEAARAIT